MTINGVMKFIASSLKSYSLDDRNQLVGCILRISHYMVISDNKYENKDAKKVGKES